MTVYQPKTDQSCHCKRGVQRDNCPDCEGTGQRIDFAAIRVRNGVSKDCPIGQSGNHSKAGEHNV